MKKYSDYNNIFSAENTVKLLEISKINEYTIKLEEDKQAFFELICSLDLVELEMLKTYIKTYLANGFIRLSKSLTRVFLFLIKSQIIASVFALFTRVLIILLLKTNICYF